MGAYMDAARLSKWQVRLGRRRRMQSYIRPVSGIDCRGP
jgi:hypothetical protein